MKTELTWLIFMVTGCLSGTHEGQQISSEPSEEISQNNISQENENFDELNSTPLSEEQDALSNNFYNEDDFSEEPLPKNISQEKPNPNHQNQKQSFSPQNQQAIHNVEATKKGWFGAPNTWFSKEAKPDASNPWFEKQGEEEKNKHFFKKHFSFKNGGHFKSQYRITRSCPVFQGPSSQTRIRFRLQAGQMIHAIRKTGGWLQIGDHSYIHELSVAIQKKQKHHVRRP
ncbi:MAG: hypothetical protein AB8C84_01925 [Oligoflexales bacterium]